MLKKIGLSLLAVSLALGAQADDFELKTHTELSYINTQGNTDTSSFSVEAKADKSWEAQSFHGYFNAYYSEDGGLASKNKWQTELNYEYAFSPYFSFNYLVGYVNDRFSGYDAQLYTGPGAVYKAITEKTQQLDIYANILYAQDDLDNAQIERYGAWRAGFVYAWQILENLKFSEEASIRSSFRTAENYFAASKTSLMTKINGNFSMGLSYKVDYVNQPPLGKEYTDRTFLTSLIIDY